MIRFSTAVFPVRWKSCNDFSLKLISRSQLSVQKQFLSKDLSFAKYSNDRSDLVKHLQEIIEINNKSMKMEQDLQDNSHNKRVKSSTISKDADEKSSLLRCLEACSTEEEKADVKMNQKNNQSVTVADHSDEIVDILRNFKTKEAEEEEGNGLDKYSKSHHQHLHDNFHEKPVVMLDFLKELKTCDVSSVNEELQDKKIRLSKNSSKSVSTKPVKHEVENFDNKLDKTIVEIVLKIVLSQEFHLGPYTTVWLVSLISSSLPDWTDIEKLKFMASEDFIKFLDIFLIIIPELNLRDVMHQIYPFCKKLPTCFSDVLHYQIFTAFEDKVNKMNETNAEEILELLRLLHSERHIEMIDDLIGVLDEKLISLYEKDKDYFFTLPVKHILLWTLRGHPDNEFRLKILLFLGVLPNRTWIYHNLSHKYGKILYEMNTDNSVTTDFERKYFKKIESLSSYSGSVNELCDFIYHHGKTVQKGQTKFQINLVNNVVNSILEQDDLSLNLVNKLVSGLQNLDYYNFKFGKFLAEFLINESESVEKNILQYNKFLGILVNYDISSLLKKDWPYLKFLLENSFFLSNKSYWYRNEHDCMNLLELANTLSFIRIFPDELLKFLSEKFNDRKTLDLPLKYLMRILQLNRTIHLFRSELQFISREMAALIRERLDHLNKEEPGFKYSMTVLNETKKFLEMKIQLDDSTLIDCYTNLGQRIPLLMAFDQENKPYSLQKFEEIKNNLQLKKLRVQENIKFVAVLFFLNNAFITSSQGVSYLKASQLQTVQFLEYEGCYVEYFKYDNILHKPGLEKGNYIYEVVKNKLNSSSGDR